MSSDHTPASGKLVTVQIGSRKLMVDVSPLSKPVRAAGVAGPIPTPWVFALIALGLAVMVLGGIEMFVVLLTVLVLALLAYVYIAAKSSPVIAPVNGQLTLTYGRLGRRRSRPATDILALQLIPGPPLRNARTRQVTGLGGNAGPDPSYELNLILDDPHEPRVHFVVGSDLDLVRRSAEAVAALVQVPVLDQIPAGG